MTHDEKSNPPEATADCKEKEAKPTAGQVGGLAVDIVVSLVDMNGSSTNAPEKSSSTGVIINEDIPHETDKRHFEVTSSLNIGTLQAVIVDTAWHEKYSIVEEASAGYADPYVDRDGHYHDALIFFSFALTNARKENRAIRYEFATNEEGNTKPHVVEAGLDKQEGVAVPYLHEREFTLNDYRLVRAFIHKVDEGR